MQHADAGPSLGFYHQMGMSTHLSYVLNNELICLQILTCKKPKAFCTSTPLRKQASVVPCTMSCTTHNQIELQIELQFEL